MHATCAICELPLVSLQKCVVIGCEVVHRACALTGRKTLYQKFCQRLAGVESDMERSQRDYAGAAHLLSQLKIEVGRLEKRLAAERETKEFALERLADAEAQRREAMAESARLRAELANIMEREDRAELATARDPVSKSEDDTAERFRLMELD